MNQALFSFKNRSRILGFFLLLSLVAGEFQAARAQSWQYIAPMKNARSRPRAAILPNGKIIVVGGNNGYEALTSCEIYDPSTNTWTNAGSLNVPRWNFQLLTLYDGRLLAAGGQTDVDCGTTPTCEIYDPTSDSWSLTATMSDPREAFQAVIIPGNKIAFIGGENGCVGYLTSCDLYDEKTETMSVFPSIQIQTSASAAFYIAQDSTIVMPGGYYYGYSGVQISSTEIYSFKLGSWGLGDSLIESQGNHYNMAQQSSTEKIFIVAGNLIPEATQVTGDVETYNPSTGEYSLSGPVTPAFLNRVLFTSRDSILDIGGQNASKNPIADCWWYDCSTMTASRAPTLPAAREEGVPLLYNSQFGGNPCLGTRTVYLFGGLDSNERALNSCLVLGLGSNPGTVVIPQSAQLAQTSCVSVDTAVPVALVGCIQGVPSLDSLWLTGSSNFAITDSRPAPRTLASLDSILLTYSGTRGPDTALLHLQYDLDSSVHDTTIQLIGTVTSPFGTQPSQIHRESASAYFGQIDSLPLAVDLSSQINIDSLWPFIADIQATYTWDSSVVSYVSYLAPAGWGVSSISHTGNAATFDIQNISSTVTQPLNLGTALFRPHSTQLSTTWVELPNFMIDAGNQALSLCVTDNEDNHWSVKTLGVLSGVAEVPLITQDISIYPNPASDELFIQNTNAFPLSIEIYDAIGREVLSAVGTPASTTTISTQSLQDGVYFFHATNGTGFSASSKVAIVK